MSMISKIMNKKGSCQVDRTILGNKDVDNFLVGSLLVVGVIIIVNSLNWTFLAALNSVYARMQNNQHG